jgi:hypothetical protein
MNKFTKGPWHVSDPNDHKNADIGISDGVFVLADMTNDIAENGYDQKANAKLIAAAPDLYEALQELVDSHSENANFPAINKARAALAKASP